MKPWKSLEAYLNWTPTELLQWGHGDEAVEERTSATDQRLIKDASMGPRR